MKKITISKEAEKHIEKLKALKAEELKKLDRRFEDADDVVSDDERADLMEDNEAMAAGGSVVSETLQKIDMAIMWAEAGYFGQCFEDLKPIEKDRLEAVPAAITCKEHRNIEENLRPENVREKIEELGSK